MAIVYRDPLRIPYLLAIGSQPRDIRIIALITQKEMVKLHVG